MPLKLVRYQVRDDRVADNARAIREVFAELRAAAPPGFRYAALQSGAEFFHVVAQREGEAAPLPSLAAFRRFAAGIEEWCSVPPQTTTIALVGGYRFFEEEEEEEEE